MSVQWVSFTHLVELGVTEGFLDGLKSSTEQISVELFKTSTSDGRVEVNTFVQGINLNAGLWVGILCIKVL